MIPLSAIPWTEAVRLMYLGKVKVIKDYDNWMIHSQHLSLKVPSIVISTEYVKYQKELKYSPGNIRLRDDFTCQLQITNRCRDQKGKVRLTELTLDHVVPKSLGGKTNWTNCCTACKECNSQKGNDPKIVPKVKPKRPSYYEILAKRKTLPIYFRDEAWRDYVDWPEHLIKVLPQPGVNG